jgi:hypothetical protein
MSQDLLPSLVVELEMVEWNAPPLNNSILTFPGRLSFQLIKCELPACQLSPPFGEVTLIKPCAKIWGKNVRTKMKLNK